MFLLILLTARLYKTSGIPINNSPWVRVYVFLLSKSILKNLVRAILLIMVWVLALVLLFMLALKSVLGFQFWFWTPSIYTGNFAA